MSKPQKDKEDGLKFVCRNKRAAYDYEIIDKLECGMMLCGTEVKSLRAGHAKLDEAYARLDGGEVWLIGAEIPEYEMGNRLNHKPKRTRKLLLHRREIERFAAKATQKGFTLVPLSLYFKNGKAKVEIAVVRGKQAHDKRESKKKAEAAREISRAMSNRTR
jgi:SsrA-binding protein